MTNITDELQQATEDLLFLSESDVPFEVICWKSDGRLTPAKLLQLTSYPKNFVRDRIITRSKISCLRESHRVAAQSKIDLTLMFGLVNQKQTVSR
ncbi:nuclease A inhibitor family protein [Microcoleus asticus]|uniref:Uncharacterized protein n=1 Tax=Microcoleus asticus IPMA8 TaxID=2563858 RepID=A0ABX2CYB5_9CYAN|nr:nuclease A inhibitor family protein [Microcoleus asticus]NQE35183.1 hypothetical protein [Microcoleus asticus IPMA8]